MKSRQQLGINKAYLRKVPSSQQRNYSLRQASSYFPPIFHSPSLLEIPNLLCVVVALKIIRNKNIMTTANSEQKEKLVCESKLE